MILCGENNKEKKEKLQKKGRKNKLGLELMAEIFYMQRETCRRKHAPHKTIPPRSLHARPQFPYKNPPKSPLPLPSPTHNPLKQQKHSQKMAKLIALAALLALLLALTTASAYRTTVVVDDTNQEGRSECREKVQLDRCRKFLDQSLETAIWAVVRGNEGREPRKEDLKPCCEELEKVDKECQCEAFAGLVGKQGGGGDAQKELAKIVLTECGLVHCEMPTPPQRFFRSNSRFY